jgi:hypothetical protein
VFKLVDTTELTFEVNYKLELLDSIFGDGPITDNSTLNDLTDMVKEINNNLIHFFGFDDFRCRQQCLIVQI